MMPCARRNSSSPICPRQNSSRRASLSTPISMRTSAQFSALCSKVSHGRRSSRRSPAPLRKPGGGPAGGRGPAGSLGDGDRLRLQRGRSAGGATASNNPRRPATGVPSPRGATGADAARAARRSPRPRGSAMTRGRLVSTASLPESWGEYSSLDVGMGSRLSPTLPTEPRGTLLGDLFRAGARPCLLLPRFSEGARLLRPARPAEAARLLSAALGGSAAAPCLPRGESGDGPACCAWRLPCASPDAAAPGVFRNACAPRGSTVACFADDPVFALDGRSLDGLSLDGRSAPGLKPHRFNAST